MQVRPIRLCAFLAVAALAAGCDVHVGENGVSLDVAHGKATDEWTRTYTVAKGGSLEIVNTTGTIVVEAATGSQVEVTATRQTRAPSDEEAQALLRELEIKEEVSPARVRLETSAGTLSGRRSASVDYQVRVPGGLQVSVRTENGGIGLHDVDGVLSASTTNGGIRGTNVSGAVSAHIVNGGIALEMARVSGPVELDTVNGGIRLDIPRDLKADIDAKAINGGVVAESELGLTGGQRTRTALTGRLNGGGVRITATTVNGGVRIGARSGAAGQSRPDNDTSISRARPSPGRR